MLFVHRFDIPSDTTAELSPKGYQFFTDIFETFDKVPRLSCVPHVEAALLTLCSLLCSLTGSRRCTVTR